MRTFPLRIGTPDGLLFKGEVERVVCRSISGDLAVLAGHCNFCTALGMGEAHIVLEDGTRREAACIGGMLSVSGGEVTLVPTTFEWADKIDVDRAEASYQRADKVLHDQNASGTELKLAEARLHRALVRKSVASKQ